MSSVRNYDSEFCGRVPLHQTNLIQPHGVLMVVQKDDLRILQVSENISDLLRRPAAEVVNTPLTQHFKTERGEGLAEKFAAAGAGRLPISLTLAGGPAEKGFLALVQAQKEYLLVEIEKEGTDGLGDSFVQVYGELKSMMAAIEQTDSVEALGAVVVRELKRISGFDKIMVYRFDAEWNGTVIAEIREEGMDAYLGLKFPASDIPKQAREMYRKSPYRLIPNRDYAPVRLFPVINPVTHGFTDLSGTNLRSVAGVHIEYLHNMQVVASMSTRIMKEDRLWGLISCHHRQAKYLSYQMRSLFELLSDIISARIASLENRAAFDFKAGMHQLQARLMERIYNSHNLREGLQLQQEGLLQLLKADGVAVVLNQQVQSMGTTPSQTELEDLVYWLQANGIHQTYQQSSLPEQYENAEVYMDIASGVLALPIQPEKGSYILAFRPEAVRQVSWGGNPEEAITFEPDRKGYHPRNSFRIWQETVRKQAIPWTEEELEIAENFRNFVVEYTLNRM